jgi:rod shape-determining protein MreC
LVLISVTVISLDESGHTHRLVSGVKSVAGDVFSPLRNGVDDVLQPIGDFFAGAAHYSSVQSENEKLQHEIGILQQELATREFDRRQAETLQRLLTLDRLPALASLPSVTAQTVNINPSNFAATIGIDKGRAQGVMVGDPVVGSGGLVGQVVQANHDTSTVRLVTDGQSHVGVTFGNGLTATVAGQGPRDPMAADFIAPSTPLHLGERMYTNGLAGAEFPPGIPIAYVTSIHTVAGADQKTVQVQPIADLDRLAYVDVIQWSPTP